MKRLKLVKLPKVEWRQSYLIQVDLVYYELWIDAVATTISIALDDIKILRKSSRADYDNWADEMIEYLTYSLSMSRQVAKYAVGLVKRIKI